MNGNDPKTVEGLEQSRGEFRKIRDGESGHTHRYTVPVEWRQVYQTMQQMTGYYPTTKVVTKLRCETCPDEIERK